MTISQGHPLVREAQGNGDPGVIMSGASIQDNRVEVGVATRHQMMETQLRNKSLR